MTKKWQFFEAQDALEEVVDAAITCGPQIVMQNGLESVVIMSVKDYESIFVSPQITPV